MDINNNISSTNLSKNITDILIRIGLIAILVYMSVKVFSPFMELMLWALILAVTLYPFLQNIEHHLNNKRGLSSTLLILFIIISLGIPTFIIGDSLVSFLQDTHKAFEEKNIQIKPPSPEVAKWPLIGDKAFQIWSEAANNPPELFERLKPRLENTSKVIVSLIAGAAGNFLQFLVSLIIAGIMMAYGQTGSQSMHRISCRFAGPQKGLKLFNLSTATIRSVAMGVVGVSFIQALLFGLGFIWIGIPGAGILALLVLIFGIAQLPALIFTIPAIAYIWWTGDSTMMNGIMTVYFIIAGFTDNVLKPVFLGRGVDAPMPVVLLGALGGLITSGMIGLFLGAVLLSLTYVIFMEWVNDTVPEDNLDTGSNDAQ